RENKQPTADERKELVLLEAELAGIGTEPELSKRIVAKRNARSCALSLAQPIFKKHKVEGWHDFVVELRTVFRAELPNQTDDGVNRFVAAIVPGITGEHTTAGAVKKYLSRT